LKLEATAGLFNGNIPLSCLSIPIKKYGEPDTAIRSARRKFLLELLKRWPLRLGIGTAISMPVGACDDPANLS
jgi:hypothetical protein